MGKSAAMRLIAFFPMMGEPRDSDFLFSASARLGLSLLYLKLFTF